MEDSFRQKAARFFSGRTRQYTIILLIVIFVFVTYRALNGRHGTISAETDSKLLGVVGTYGDTVFVAFADMTQVELVNTVTFGTMLEGDERKNTMSGRYENDAFGPYTLHVYPASSPYIVISYGDGETLVFNQRTARQTQAIYQDILEYTA